MEKYLNKNNAMKSYLAGVVFNNVYPNDTELPKNIAVSNGIN